MNFIFFSGKFDKDSFISPSMDEQKNIKQKKICCEKGSSACIDREKKREEKIDIH